MWLTLMIGPGGSLVWDKYRMYKSFSESKVLWHKHFMISFIGIKKVDGNAVLTSTHFFNLQKIKKIYSLYSPPPRRELEERLGVVPELLEELLRLLRL